jgi:hypothetical protein
VAVVLLYVQKRDSLIFGGFGVPCRSLNFLGNYRANVWFKEKDSPSSDIHFDSLWSFLDVVSMPPKK